MSMTDEMVEKAIVECIKAVSPNGVEIDRERITRMVHDIRNQVIEEIALFAESQGWDSERMSRNADCAGDIRTLKSKE